MQPPTLVKVDEAQPETADAGRTMTVMQDVVVGLWQVQRLRLLGVLQEAEYGRVLKGSSGWSCRKCEFREKARRLRLQAREPRSQPEAAHLRLRSGSGRSGNAASPWHCPGTPSQYRDSGHQQTAAVCCSHCAVWCPAPAERARLRLWRLGQRILLGFRRRLKLRRACRRSQLEGVSSL